jgi:hypothetical protein
LLAIAKENVVANKDGHAEKRRQSRHAPTLNGDHGHQHGQRCADHSDTRQTGCPRRLYKAFLN